MEHTPLFQECTAVLQAAKDLKTIAEVAEKYDVPLVKLTGGQRIGLFGVKKEDLPAIWEDLAYAIRLCVR